MAGLNIALVVCLAVPVLAAEPSEKKSEERPTLKPSVIAVPEFLERAAKSPLGPGDIGMLRAVADLLEKEQMPNPVLPHPVIPYPTPEQPRRLVIRLNYSRAIDVAKALEEFGSHLSIPLVSPTHVVVVTEPVSNSLLLSASPAMIDTLTEMIAELDTQPPIVTVSVCIAELLPEADDAKADESTPSMDEDPTAWLDWAKKQGRLRILSQPQIMTLDNQPASIKIGSIVPVVTATQHGGYGTATKVEQIEQVEVGLSLKLTPRISPEGLVIMDLDVEYTSVDAHAEASGPTIRKVSAQTTIAVEDGQTMILGGLIQRTENHECRLIIAVTPRVNPVK